MNGNDWPEQQPPRQDSLVAQLVELHRLANRLGMYDAADWLWNTMPTGFYRAGIS